MYKIYIKIFLCFLLVINELQAGGPWTKEKGELYAQFAIYAIPSTNRFSINAFRTKFLNRGIFDITTEFYVEYGVHKRLTFLTSLPLKIVSSSEQIFPLDTALMGDNDIGQPSEILDAGVLVDLGNICLGAKYNFYSNAKMAFSGQFVLSMPTAIQPYNPRTALRTAYPCWGFMPTISIGTSKTKIYTYFETGMNFRTHNYSHQYIANFEFGWKVSKTVYLAVALNAIICLPGGFDIPNSNNESFQTGLYINNQNFVAFTFKSIIPIGEHFGLNLSLAGGIWANNVQQGPNIGIGVFYKFKPKPKAPTES